MTTLTLGAPSIRKEDARKQLDQHLGGAKFPLQARITNHLPFQVTVGGVFLRPSGHQGNVGQAKFGSRAEFARFVTDVQAVADLHKAETALSVELPSGAPASGSRKTATSKPEAAKAE